MAESTGLIPFQLDDRFLRRVRMPDHFNDRTGIVYWRAFKDKTATLSFTFQNDDLSTPEGIQAYRVYFSLMMAGTLPGIVWLSLAGLTRHLRPPLPPRHDRDEADIKYGHLHCVTDSPNRVQMELMAKLVNDAAVGGVICVVTRPT